MNSIKYVAYYRVSTQRQGRSGLGLSDQQYSVNRFTANGVLLKTFTDIESAKSTVNRPELHAALEYATKNDCILLVATLDRLSRDLAFIATLQNSKVRFICCDMPEANEVTVGLMAVLAQWERKQISARTKKALQAKMANNPNGFTDRNGVWRTSLGNPETFTQEGRLRGAATTRLRASQNENNKKATAMALSLLRNGHTYREIVDSLNEGGFKTSTGGTFSVTQLSRLLARRRREVAEQKQKNTLVSQ